MNKNQDGFSAVEVLLVLVILGLISFAGWYVWKANHNAVTSNNNSPSISTTTQPNTKSKTNTTINTTAKDELFTKLEISSETKNKTKDWVQITNIDKAFKFIIPSTWYVLICDDFEGGPVIAKDIKADSLKGDPQYVHIGPTKDSAGTCDADSESKVTLMHYVNPNESNTYPSKQEEDKSFTIEKLTLENLKGYKSTTIYKAGIRTSEDDKVIEYRFYDNGKIYVASYSQKAKDPDDSNTFDMIVQTLQIIN